jgi:hypothetical protein
MNWCSHRIQSEVLFPALPLYISLYHMCLLSCLDYYLYIFPYITCVYYRVYIIPFIYFLISHVSTIVFILIIFPEGNARGEYGSRG